MPTADATLLPPVAPLEERQSSRTLEDVGALSVLEAMVEQKRRSSIPAAEEIEPLAETEREPQRAPTHSDAYLKAR